MATLTTSSTDTPALDPLLDDASATLDDAALLTPTVTIASSSNPSSIGGSVTFTVTVTGSGGTPTGAVYIADGPTYSTILVNGSLTSGSFAYTTSALSAGSHTITAFYFGDNGVTYDSAFSSSLTQIVGPVITGTSNRWRGKSR